MFVNILTAIENWCNKIRLKCVKIKNLDTYIVIAAIFLGLIIYNHKRIFSVYDFDIINKFSTGQVHVSLIPFKNIQYRWEIASDRILIKIAFFSIIGFLLSVVLIKTRKYKGKYFFMCSIIIIIITEMLAVLTSGFLPVPIDMNNTIFYLCGLYSGYIVTWFINIFIYKKLASNIKPK